ncbi:MAG: hypothetical protein AAGC70_08805 [Pseudomonadota bacterium]
MRETSKSLTLDAFIARLSDEDAGHARVAASQMDALEKRVAHLAEVDAKFARWAVWTLVAFVVGAVAAVVRTWPIGLVYALIGPIGIVALMSGLPGLALVYAFRVRERTSIDNQKIELNRHHFLPHGAYYFPPETDSGQGCVVEITERPPERRRYTRYDHLRPGRIW